MSKSNFILFIVMVVFIVLNMMPQTIQAGILGIISVYVVFIWLKNRKINKWAAYFFIVLSFIIVFSLVSTHAFSLYYFISELKIVEIFTLPVAFYLILKNIDLKKFVIKFFKLLSLIVLFIGIYGYIAKGMLRYTGFLPHSIYISVCLVLLLSFLYHEVKFRWRFVTLINVLMLGSSSGVLMFLVMILFRLKVALWKKVVPLILGMFVFYWYAVGFRGREIIGSGFWEIDRVQIFLSVINYTIHNFNPINYLIGFGVGAPLIDFSFNNPLVPYVSMGFVNWFMSFTHNGVYPFAFHNEFLRIFYDFGILGFWLIIRYLYKSLERPTFILLLIACLTNTIIYSTVGLFIISMLICVIQIERSNKMKTLEMENKKAA